MNAGVWRSQRTFIVALAAFALIRPLMSITGLSEWIGQPFASLAATAVVSVVWIAAAILARVERPVPTLMMTGLAYGIFAIVLSAILSPILSGHLQGPLTNPFGFVGVLVTNAIWGTLAGLVAALLQARRR